MEKPHIILIQTCKPSLITDKYADRYPYPPIGLQYLLGILKMNGYEVSIIDFYLKPLKRDEFIEILTNMKKPVLIGVSSYTDSIEQAYKIIKTIKNVYTDVPVMIGGTHVSFMYNEVMEECKEIDFANIGEGEGLIIELLEYIRFKAPSLKDIPNLVYRDVDGKIMKNEKRGYVTNLDISPLLWYPEEMNEFIQSDGGLVFVSSRGCPGGCTFCASRALSGPRYRSHSAEWIISLLYYYNTEIGFHIFGPLDDTFTVDRKRLRKFVSYIKQLNYQFPWSCKSRVDVINEELVDLLKKAGCVSVHIGVESGDEKVLKSIDKKISLVQVFNAIKLLSSRGIRSECSFIIGHPTDTLETIEKTLILASKLDETGVSLSVLGICTPFPGTVIWNKSQEYGMTITTNNWKKYDLGTPIFYTENYNLDDIRRAFFYFNYDYKIGKVHPGLTQCNHDEYIKNIDEFVECLNV